MCYHCTNSTRHATHSDQRPRASLLLYNLFIIIHAFIFCFTKHFLKVFLCSCFYVRKTALPISLQIEQLKQRGLQIEDEDNAAHLLGHISYYRLAGWWWPMQMDKENHIFKPNSRFADVIALYDFDRELRLLLFDVIEKIEISLKTKLIYHLSQEFNPWWFQNTTLFINTSELIKTLSSIESEIDRSKDIFFVTTNKR